MAKGARSQIEYYIDYKYYINLLNTNIRTVAGQEMMRWWNEVVFEGRHLEDRTQLARDYREVNDLIDELDAIARHEAELEEAEGNNEGGNNE